MLRLLWQPFYTAYVLLSFVASLILGCPVFLLLHLCYGSRTSRPYFMVAHYWAAIWLALIGMPVRRIGRWPAQDAYVVVANHISYIDPVVAFAAIPEPYRPLARKDFEKIPLLGFVYKKLALLVDRDSRTSRAKSFRLMWTTLRKGTNILIFPEGSFNEEEGVLIKQFFDGAFRLALKARTPVMPVLFPDTVRRWHYSAWWKLSPGRNRAVYLDPVPVEGYTDTDLEAFKEKVHEVMRTAMEELKK